MKKIAAYLFFLFSLFAGCVNEHVGESLSLVVIRGGQIQCTGRAAEENTRFQAGDVISFFSQGGIEADNVCLTYENGMWKHGGALSWNTSGKDASFTAFYPCFESGVWDYYDEDGFLEDIIYAKGEVSSGMFIELGFQHLFSKIIFEVDGEMNEQIQHITFTPSVQIESVLPLTGEIVLTGTPAEPFQIEKQSDGIYSFFVPSAHEVTIDIQITTSEGKQLPLATTVSQSYQSGYQYTYHLAPEVHEVGIYTVEDFIAFTHLINGMSYPGRTLDEFGETVDGRTTYYLRNDLHFTEETSKDVQPIGFRRIKYTSRKNFAFKDCFDGKGHTLNGLQIITVDVTDSQGLFCDIDEQGVVKNLNMENCSYVNANINNIMQRAGILAGWNEGTIIGCHIKGGKIENKKSGNASGIVCDNKGSVLNCTVNDMQFIGNELRIGGLCYDNSADIINCGVMRCSAISNKCAGGLCYNVASGSTILNCYVYSLDAENTDAGALFYQGNNSVTITINCYYQGDVSLKPIYNTFTYNKGAVYTYGADFTVTDKGCSLLEALNGWVEDNQGKYSGYSLDYWQKGDENISFIHQSSQ